MAKHEVIIHENTGATAESAPYLGNYVTKNTNKIEAYSADLTKECGLPETQVVAILTGAFNEFVALEKKSPTRLNTDLGQICLSITGSFPTADAAFDSTKNTLDLVVRPDTDIKNELADVTPTIVTDETLTKVRVDSIADTEVERPQNVIYGTREFIVAGMNLVTTDAGASVYLENNIGTTFPCTVVEVLSKQRIKVKSNAANPGGDYKLVVKSRGGDAEGPLQTSFRKVKYIYIEPVPAMTKVQQGNRAAGVAGFGQGEAAVITITGSFPGGKKSTDALKLDCLNSDGSILATMAATEYITASTETTLTLGNGIDNDSEKPDGDWQNKQAKFTFVRDGVEYPLSFTFLNA